MNKTNGRPFGLKLAVRIASSNNSTRMAFKLPSHSLGASTFVWLLIAYWIPPLPMRDYALANSGISLSIVVWLLAKLQPDWF